MSSVSSIADLIALMISGISPVMSGIANAIKLAFLALLYEDPAAASPVFSQFAVWSFAIMGVTIGLGLTYTVIRFVTQRRGI